MKKRYIGLLLCVALLSCCLFAIAEDEDSITFDSTVLKLFDLSASEWYESDTSRSVFAVLANLELSQEFGTDRFLIDSSTSSYISYNPSIATVIGIFAGQNDKIATVLYTPLLEQCMVTFYNGNSSMVPILAAGLTDNVAGTSPVKEVTSYEFALALSAIGEALSD